MNEKLQGARTLRELFERALTCLLEQLNPERAFVAYKEKDSKDMTPQGTHGIDPHAIFVAGEISTELLKQVTREGKPLCLVDAIHHPGLANRSSVILSGLRSIVCAPLLHPSGLVVGILYADNRLKAGAFGDQELGWMTDLASAVSELLVPITRQLETANKASATEDDEEEWRSLRSSGIKMFQAGQVAEAEPILVRALEVAEKFGSRDARLAKTLGELAELLRTQGRLEESERYLIRSIEIFEKLGDHHNPDLAPSLNNLAGIYYSQGNGVRAEDLYRRALSIWKMTLSEDDRRLAPVLYNLATIRRANGAFAEAAEFFKQALSIAQKAWGAEHAHTKRCQASYEETLAQAQGK